MIEIDGDNLSSTLFTLMPKLKNYSKFWSINNIIIDSSEYLAVECLAFNNYELYFSVIYK